MANIMQYKILLVGPANVGKTSFVREKKPTDILPEKYLPTLGVEVVPKLYFTQQGQVIFNVWDFGGQDKFTVPTNSFYPGAQGALVMLDASSPAPESVPLLEYYLAEVEKLCGCIPVVIVFNKMEEGWQEIPLSPELPYYLISVKDNYDCQRPFEHLLRELVGPETEAVTI